MKKQAQPAHRANRHRLPQLVRRLIAVLLAAALALTVWTYRAALTPTNIKAWVQENLLGNVGGGGYPVGFSGSADPGNFSVSGDAPALVTDMMFIHLSTSGKTRAQQQHGYTSPFLRRSGSCFLLLDLGGKNFRTSTDGVQFSENTEYPYTLFGGAAAQNGSYALVSMSTGYTSQVTVFDSAGQTRFEWASQTDLISAVAFSADGKRLAAASFTSQSGQLRAAVRIFALDQKEPLAVQTYDGLMPLDIAFRSDGAAICVGDTGTVCLSPDGTSQLYDYDGQILSAYALHPTAGAALALSAAADGRAGSLVRLDGDFAAHTLTRFSQPIIDLDLAETQLLVLQSGVVTRWNVDNAQDGVAEVGTDCTRVCADSGAGFFLLGASEVRHCTGFDGAEAAP